MSKADLLKTKVVTDETVQALGDAPADSSGNVVFFSVCDGSTRAKVYNGTGKTLSDAWEDAVRRTLKGIKDDSVEPKWLRVDVVSNSWPMTPDLLLAELKEVPDGFDYHGLALDSRFHTALLEGELNGRKIYDYEDNGISINRLNDWLEDNGRKALQELPENMVGFECWGWICDEDKAVFSLCREGADIGRRQVAAIDADYTKNIIDKSSSFLMDQVREDGTFVYGIRPQFDKEIDDYNILRHSGTIWSLICRYRMFPDEALKEKIDRTIDYMLSQIRYDQDGAGYLYEEKDGEFKIGGNGIAVVTLTEYMDLFKNENYRDVCIELGEGILKQQDPENGSYWHIMNFDFSRAENFRTVYYDGECTFALARLYSLTKEQKWLDAACKAIDHFIAKDYTQYRDHWVAYSLNEVTKYVDRQEYYDFALANATNNYARILGRARTYPTNLELLISSFETWQRMADKGIDTGDFDVQDLLDAIAARANRQLSGYFYPELAMYMENPQSILESFMMRDDKFRVRIDDVQHNIGGFYLYWRNYDAMLAAGLDPGRMDDTKFDD
ncbi:MAG: glycosyl hydrolase family 88 [Oscillospiraceae bacterium]|nr:glycosyl hydrolase family 88 [Oscillospiraceae bacterium]